MSISGHIKPAHNYVPEYQQSGIPWVKTNTTPAVVTGEVEGVANVITNISDFKISFDRVTRWIMIHNHDHQDTEHLRIYFSEDSAKNAYSANDNGKYFLIDGEAETNRLEVKCKYLYIVPDDSAVTITYSLMAGLTNILASDFPEQSSANGFEGI